MIATEPAQDLAIRILAELAGTDRLDPRLPTVLGRLRGILLDEPLTIAQAAAWCGVSPKTIARWRKERGLVFEAHKITAGSRKPRYYILARNLIEWLHRYRAGVD